MLVQFTKSNSVTQIFFKNGGPLGWRPHSNVSLHSPQVRLCLHLVHSGAHTIVSLKTVPVSMLPLRPDFSFLPVGIVSVCWRSSEAWSLVKLFRSRMHRFGVDVLVRVLNSYLLVTGTCFYQVNLDQEQLISGLMFLTVVVECQGWKRRLLVCDRACSHWV